LYRWKNISGNIFLWGGFATVVGGALHLSLQDANSRDFNRNVQTSFGLMLGGLFVEIIGSFILTSGQENIFNAVRLYNRNRIEDYAFR